MSEWPCFRCVSGLCSDPQCNGGRYCQAVLCTPPLRCIACNGRGYLIGTPNSCPVCEGTGVEIP